MGNSSEAVQRIEENNSMPWKGRTVLDEKIAFVVDYEKSVESGEKTMTELCHEHGISRKTGYQNIEKKRRHGWAGLAEQSRAPRGGEHWNDPDEIMRVLQTRLDYPDWGAETIVSYLTRVEPQVRWPAASVAHEWIKKAGLVNATPRRRRHPHPGPPPPITLTRPNQQWSVDFKGHFRTRDRRYCYPLTVADSFSRYVIGCVALQSTAFELVWPVFERLFREFGLPESILSDNGSPFSSNSVKRLSKLSVRWIRLGIRPRLIEPGKPYQNGSHERMHRHLKLLACKRPSANSIQQQVQFDRFNQLYNHVRPHAALGGDRPVDRYTPSSRRFPAQLPPVEYPTHMHVRRVRSSGEIKWDGQWFFVSEALVGEPVAFELIDDGCWILRFADVELGYYSQRQRKLHLDRKKPDGKAENK